MRVVTATSKLQYTELYRLQLFYHISCINRKETINTFFRKKTTNSFQPTIIFIIFWDFSMFYKIFFSPPVKRCAIVTYLRNMIYKLIHKLPNDWTDLRRFGKIRKISKLHRMIAQRPASFTNGNYCQQ